MFRFACPKCSKTLKAEHYKPGAQCTCPRCGQRMSVPPPAANPVDTAPPPRPSPPLPAIMLPAVVVPPTNAFDFEASDVERLPTRHHGQGRQERFHEGSQSSLATVLGICSLACGVAGALFLVLPCFWFLALPISGIGTVLGLGGVIAAFSRRGGGLGCATLGLLVSTLLTILSFFLVMWAHMRLSEALDKLHGPSY